MTMQELYSDIIIEHNRSKHNKKEMPDPDSFARGHNPNCGDDLSIYLKVEGNCIKDITYFGSGCAISEASASIMIDLLKGKSVSDAKNAITSFISMIKKEKKSEDLEELLQDATILSNISNMPGRVRCAVLAWHALDEAIKKANSH